MFSNCITPTTLLFAYVMYSNIMSNVIIFLRHGRFFSLVWCNPLLLQMCINGFLSLSSTEILHRSGILVLTMNSFLVKVCILLHPDLSILISLSNIIFIWISNLDRSNVLLSYGIILLMLANFESVAFDLDPV